MTYFDEQPDGDPHGECVAEIHRLEEENRQLRAERDALLEALQAFSDYVHSEQCSEDGPAPYSYGRINALAFKARTAIAIAKVKGEDE